MPDPRDRISAVCTEGRHHRCTGWMVIPDESSFGRRNKVDQSVRCECITCRHPPVAKRHHLESQARGVH